MNRNLILILGWYGATLLTFTFSLLFLIYLLTPQKITLKSNQYRLYQALPINQMQISDNVIRTDARNLIVESFFKDHQSILNNFAQTFISVADFYHLDFRLLPAITMQESNGAKKFPENSYNPFGYGIYGSKKVHFDSFEDAIETVGKALREDYLNEGLHTPEQIMTKYTPPSLLKGGAWAKGVTQFMEELR